MPRNQIQFEDDAPEEQEDEATEGREVDLAEADQDEVDAEGEGLDDLPAGRVQRGKKKDEDEDSGSEQDLDDEDVEELRGRAGKRGDWRQRLLRTEKLAEDLADNLATERERNDALERKITKREADTTLATKKAEAEVKLVKLRKELADAMEAGNTADTIRLQEEMADIKADVKTAERAAEAAPKVEAPVAGPPRKAKKWMASHPRFNTDPIFKAFVQAADKTVAAAGLDANSDEYWEALDKHVKKRYPEEYREALPTRRRHPANGGDRDDSQGGNARSTKSGFQKRGSKVVLNEKQLRNMARFGMDPESPEDQKAYIRNNIGGGR